MRVPDLPSPVPARTGPRRGAARRALTVGACGLLALAATGAPALAGATPTAPAPAPQETAPDLAAAAAPTPLPEVTGPLPVTATSYPFGAADHQRVPEDLARYGYVEEEFLVSGKANVYDWPGPGPAVVRTPDVPYTTRVLVRRPASRDAFSGNVVVEMLNPSNLYDLNIGWALSHGQFLRQGDVWVGITVKPVTVASLKTFDPERYAPLSFRNPLPLSSPRNCAEPNTLIAGDSSRRTENGLAWDVHSQVGAWLKSRARSNPLTYGVPASAPRPVQQLYGFGYSQTGGYLYTYINAIAPLDVRRNGAPIFDGYLVAVAGGAFAGTVPINQCAPSIGVDDPRNQIRGAGVPVIHVMSASDYLLGIDSRRPDSDAPGDRYRHYEVPGMGHATPDELYWSAAPEDIVRAGRTVPSISCGDGPRSRFPSGLVFDAAFQNLDRWVRRDVPPPRVPRIQVRDGQGVTDRFGNLVGGYRTPLVDVPTSTWYGSSSGGGFCFIAGHEVPFGEDRLQRLYGSHARYVQAVSRSVDALVDDRLLTVADGRWVVEQARVSDVPESPDYPGPGGGEPQPRPLP